MKNKIKFLPGIAWFFLVLILICIPGKQFPLHNPWLEKIFFDKWVHVGLFGMLNLLWLYAITKINIDYNAQLQWGYKISMAIAVWAITTEFIQKYFIPFRSFDMWDWAADCFGILCGFLFWKKKWLTQKL